MADDQGGDPRDAAPLEGEVRTREEMRQEITPIDTSVIGGLTRAEIDVQIATAHKYRRSITTVQRQIESFATLDVETATSCFFRKPQREKKKNPQTGKEEWVDGYIEGPSIRFAEIVMQAWGNGRVASRVTDQTETEIEATGIFHDLESNVAWAKSVRVSILGANGRKFPGHLITTLGNAAASKAIRNAIYAGVPRGIWNRGYRAALAAAKGDAKTLPERRKAMFAKAAEENITPAEIFAMLGVKGEADIGIDQLFDAAALLTAIRDGEATIEELIALKQPVVDERGLSEAFGKQAPPPTGAADNRRKTDDKPAKESPKSPPPPPASKAAPTAETAKPTSDSATAASGASPAETSGPKEPEKPSGDGGKDDLAQERQRADQANDAAQAAAQGKVVDFPGDRKAPEPAHDPETGEVQESPEIDPAPFNAFADQVTNTGDWPTLKGLTSAFRRTPAMAGAPLDLQRQAMVLALNHVRKNEWPIPEGDVEFYRLWLNEVVDRTLAGDEGARGEVRPAFRKIMRAASGEYNALPSTEKDAVVEETNRTAED